MSLFNNIIPSLNRVPATAGTAPAAQATRAIKPSYDVQENAESFRLTVQLPGVAREGLELTIENDNLRIVGSRTWIQPAGWTALHRETADAGYELVLAHDNSLDAAKASAELHEGVLQVTLPKHEALKPRKIAVA